MLHPSMNAGANRVARAMDNNRPVANMPYSEKRNDLGKEVVSVGLEFSLL